MNYHEAFYENYETVNILESMLMRGTLEFNLPENEVEYYNAVNGHKYRSLITDLVVRIEETIKECVGTDEAKYLSKILGHINSEAVELDVKVNRK